MKGLFLLILGSLVCSAPALAAPSLVLLEDNGDSNPVYRKVIEGIGAAIVGNNLGQKYDHIDVLTGERATREAFFAQLRLRGARGVVDAVILTHGEPHRLSLGAGDITDADLRAAGRFPGLRLVYMMACDGSTLLDAWHAAGAQLVVGHQDLNSLPGFFFPRFLKRWSEGASARDAAQEAYEFAESTARDVSPYITDESLLGTVGIGRSEPVLKGVDLDISGQTYPAHALGISVLPRPPASSAPVPVFAHSGFEKLGLQVAAAIVPQAALNFKAIPSAQALVDRLGIPAWSELQDSFPDPTGTASGEVWVDGDELRYFLDALRSWGGDRVNALLDGVQGARLSRDGSAVSAAVYFNDPVTLSIADEDSTPNWRPYAIYLPKAVRFEAAMNDGVIYLSGLDQGPDAASLKLKMPALPDTVYVRSISVNLGTGAIRVEAGVIGNAITVYANGTLQAQNITGVDVWSTISANLDFLLWPTLAFAVL